MAKIWSKAPSPCIDVCKFRYGAHCIGCQMTKPEKKRFRKLKGKAEIRPFFERLSERLASKDRYSYWSRMYRRRCEKKGVDCPLDKLEPRREDLAA